MTSKDPTGKQCNKARKLLHLQVRMVQDKYLKHQIFQTAQEGPSRKVELGGEDSNICQPSLVVHITLVDVSVIRSESCSYQMMINFAPHNDLLKCSFQIAKGCTLFSRLSYGANTCPVVSSARPTQDICPHLIKLLGIFLHGKHNDHPLVLNSARQRKHLTLCGIRTLGVRGFLGKSQAPCRAFVPGNRMCQRRRRKSRCECDSSTDWSPAILARLSCCFVRSSDNKLP